MIGLEAYGPHTLFIGGSGARLAEVVRAVIIGGAIQRSPEELHFYIIDELGQGLSSLQGASTHWQRGRAERTLGITYYPTPCHGRGQAQVQTSLTSGWRPFMNFSRRPTRTLPDVVLVVHGADRLLMHGESQPSPILPPLLGLVSEAVGTGVRVLLTGFIVICPPPTWLPDRTPFRARVR